jgi:vesicle transport through interaction with t-SNAREs protein 1
MEIELNTLPPPAKQSLQPKVKSYKEQLKNSKKQFSTLKASNASERDELLGPYGSTTQGGNTLAQEQRGRVLSGTERLTDGSRRLEEARRVALDTGNLFSMVGLFLWSTVFLGD